MTSSVPQPSGTATENRRYARTMARPLRIGYANAIFHAEPRQCATDDREGRRGPRQVGGTAPTQRRGAGVAAVRVRLDDEPLPPFPPVSQMRARPGVDAVVHAAAKHFGVDPQGWGEGRRCNGMGRAVAAYLARGLYAASGREIAAHLGCRNASRISVACRRVKAAMKDRRLARDLDRLRQALS